MPDGGAGDSARTSDRILSSLREFAFPLSIPSQGRTRAFEYLERGYKFRSLVEVNEFNVKGAHPVPETSYNLVLRYRPLESPFRAKLRAGEGADNFVRGLAAALDDRGTHYAQPIEPNQESLVRKMLAQRDLFQVYGLLVVAREHAVESRELADQLLSRLALLIEGTLFRFEEFRELVASRPENPPNGFRTELRYRLSDDYFPLVALGEEPGWLDLTNRGTPFRHFTDYRARTFVRVHLRSRTMTPGQLRVLHEDLYKKYADLLHQVAVRQEVPQGLETVLVRTVGVLLRDGTFRDSTWPEEIIVRAFKYPVATLDLTTSDFSGTLLYQYKLSRERLLERPQSLGLVRVRDDESQFFGFFGDVPDPRNAYSMTTTTMRENCIGCHAELFYGLNTVFSFERDPRLERERDDNELWEELGDGAYKLRTPEFVSLTSQLKEVSAQFQ